MVNLQTVGGKKRRNLVKGVKGNAIYFPMNITATQTHLRKTLIMPSPEALQIVVRGLPKSSENARIIRENLVDVGKVSEWLHFLKAQNPLYADVQILDVAEMRENLEAGLSVNSAEERVEGAALSEAEIGTLLKKVLGRTGGNDQVTLIPVDRNLLPDRTNIQIYEKQRIEEGALSYFATPNLDLLCFPILFPFGRYGQNSQRKVKIGVAETLKWFLRNRDSRFRKDFQFLFHLLQVKRRQDMDSAVFSQLHTKNLRGLSAGRVCEMVAGADGNLEQNIRTLLCNIPGTPQWWRQFENGIYAMTRECGPPTFFLTLTLNEYVNEFFKKALHKFNPHWTGTDLADIDQLTAQDPVAVGIISEYFFKKVFFEVILKKGGGPLGCVIDYIFRKEYQVGFFYEFKKAMFLILSIFRKIFELLLF